MVGNELLLGPGRLNGLRSNQLKSVTRTHIEKQRAPEGANQQQKTGSETKLCSCLALPRGETVEGSRGKHTNILDMRGINLLYSTSLLWMCTEQLLSARHHPSTGCIMMVNIRDGFICSCCWQSGREDKVKCERAGQGNPRPLHSLFPNAKLPVEGGTLG